MPEAEDEAWKAAAGETTAEPAGKDGSLGEAACAVFPDSVAPQAGVARPGFVAAGAQAPPPLPLRRIAANVPNR